jgi:hypothetical protein
MTEQTEGTDIVQIALTTTFAHGEDMVSVPETPAASDGLHAIEAKSRNLCSSADAFECSIHSHGIDLAGRTTSPVASKDLVAQIARISPKTPLVDAVVAAKGAPALCENFELAPTAKRQAVWAFGEGLSRSAPTWQSTGNEHWFLRTQSGSIRVGQTA